MDQRDVEYILGICCQDIPWDCNEDLMPRLVHIPISGPTLKYQTAQGFPRLEDLAILYLSMALSVNEVGAPKCFLVV